MGNRNALIWGVMLAASVAVIVAVAFLLVPEAARGDRFLLVLGSACFAAILTFGYPMVAPPLSESGRQPAGYGMLIWAYDAGVAVLAALALLGLGFKLLLAGHLIWLLLVFLGGGMWLMGNRAAEDVAAENRK